MIELIKGDITELNVDAIVNAANSQLQMGGGVAGAIDRKGGASIQQECDAIGHCPVGSAMITGGGLLKAKYVIHAVGPRWGEGDEDAKLAGAVISSLKLADQKKLKSIALPAISTGIFHFPLEQAARVILSSILLYLDDTKSGLKVTICLYDERSLNVFRKILNQLRK